MQALRRALEQRRPAPGLVHHSDRGVQYASREYTTLLQAHGITISMSRKGNPYDNAIAESFMKTLKYEQVYREDYQDYEDLREAHASIRRFLEQVYNEKRLHSAAGLSSARRIRASAGGGPGHKPKTWKVSGSATQGGAMSFFRHEEIYRPMGRVKMSGAAELRPPQRSSVR